MKESDQIVVESLFHRAEQTKRSIRAQKGYETRRAVQEVRSKESSRRDVRGAHALETGLRVHLRGGGRQNGGLTKNRGAAESEENVGPATPRQVSQGKL